MILANGQFRVVFTARDYQAAVAYYRDDLELPIDHDWDFGQGDRGTVFKAGAGMVEIFDLRPGADYEKPQGIGLLIQVDDADFWQERAKERGLVLIQEALTYPWGHRVVRLADPDGIVVSLFSIVTV